MFYYFPDTCSWEAAMSPTGNPGMQSCGSGACPHTGLQARRAPCRMGSESQDAPGSQQQQNVQFQETVLGKWESQKFGVVG